MFDGGYIAFDSQLAGFMSPSSVRESRMDIIRGRVSMIGRSARSR
jgi:hypothetical protein